MTETESSFVETKVKNWDDFSKIVNILDIAIPPQFQYVYRGQSKSNWDLVPSFHRNFESIPLPKTEELLRIEMQAGKDFFSQAHLHLSPNLASIAKNALAAWMLMQHHNAPTRLLDWTSSPYVAAYYACCDNIEKNGAVWILHGGILHEQMKDAYNVGSVPPDDPQEDYFIQPNSTEEVFFATPIFKTDRMVAQQGLFTVCRNISGDQHKIISDVLAKSEEGGIHFLKTIIPHDQKVEFLRKLRAMNITANSLLPGLDGLGRSVKELIILNALNIEKHEEN